MKPVEAFYVAAHALTTGATMAAKGAKAAGNSAWAFTNWTSGVTAMESRGLERGKGRGTKLADVAAKVFGIGGPVVTLLALSPVIGPLSVPVALAVGYAGSVTPLGIQAAYRVGEHDNKKDKAQKTQAKGPAANA